VSAARRHIAPFRTGGSHSLAPADEELDFVPSQNIRCVFFCLGFPNPSRFRVGAYILSPPGQAGRVPWRCLSRSTKRMCMGRGQPSAGHVISQMRWDQLSTTEFQRCKTPVSS
jgi:hypothetical protein